MDPHLEPEPAASAAAASPRVESPLARRSALREKVPMWDKLRALGFASASAEEREAMLRDKELREAIAKVLAGRVPAADIEDVVQETLIAAYEATRLPADPQKRRQYVFGVARNRAYKHRRKLRITPQPGREENVEDLPPAVPVGSSTAAMTLVDQRDLLKKVAVDLTPSQLVTLEWLARQMMGESLAVWPPRRASTSRSPTSAWPRCSAA